ncbi:MAG: PEP-CTERM sorting domain-containing protein, partial [Luteolibacter sp.]
QSGLYSFLSIANFPKAWDNFSFLYAGSFNPTAPLANVLIGNDDQPTVGLSGFSYNLTADSQYFFVTTGFGNSDFGTFTNTISGPGNVFLGSNARVPEAGAILPVFAVVLVGLGFCRRLGKRSKAISA